MVANYSGSGSQETALHTGVILTTTKTKAGTYHVQQNKQNSYLDFFGRPLGNDWANFTTTVGVIKVSGVINRFSLDTIIGVNIGGISIGSFNGNPQTLMTINIDLDCAAGSLQLTALGDDVWLNVDMDVFQIDNENRAQQVKLSDSVCVKSLPQEMCEPWIPTR
ncbi:uncharacterized protein ACLA_004010 [Aspergillus clavatus NRRL 1]|uniref:Uncharacterized protein n=1 Tax=Aspergillus clavatus (strain ATCC 1007 / CBS 513.65 / DSM 816 / NCTC 3887 / NRRL 1 / QM 1276 / 107) TaxID=344612 RepID=A1C5M0_ASPCL|nr:uncharacterized protein ACLA_004010 [Aspergillus clavatus NRRL 1]EAW14988.1 hypothetical protein ACLA_004010 [Aspergillus clavatus NRRL 1]